MRIIKLAVSLLLSFLAAAIGNLATLPNIPTWYAELNKPFFNPPNWLFGPVWTLLYILIGISFYFIWTAETKKPKKTAYVIFFTQLALNATWSLIFFGLHSLWGGLAIIAALLINIALLIVYFQKIRPIASYLLIPYLAWVTFATCLNFALAIIKSLTACICLSTSYRILQRP
jgi:benzodiazapine receptor